MICCLRRRWWCKIIRIAAEKGSFVRTGKHVLDTDSCSHSDATMKDLWRRFFYSFNGWSRSWFKIMLWWSWGPFIHFVKRSSWFFCVMKLNVVQLLDLLARKNWYSSTAMVDEWNASVLSACFRSPLQFNCKLVRYCNIRLSLDSVVLVFPVVSPRVDFWHFRKFLWNSDRHWTLILGKD